MGKVIFCLLIMFCVWGKLTTGKPLPHQRMSPEDFEWINEEENTPQEETPVVVNEETGGSHEMTVEDNIRRMQGNRNR